MTSRWHRDRASMSGFTLVETLIAVAMMVAIIAALATVTAQWLPNWNRGFARVQQGELLALGIERIVADLAAAEFVPPHGLTKDPLFDGAELSVTFVRTAIGPNTSRGLEVVRLAEINEGRGLTMVRLRAPFAPLPPQGPPTSYLRLGDPVVLVRAPYRISFAYAGPDRVWQSIWRNATQLPRAVRITLRNAATQAVLSASTATMIHVEAAADCVRAKNPRDCNNPRPSENL
jgi:general secretion pathway protein J